MSKLEWVDDQYGGGCKADVGKVGHLSVFWAVSGDSGWEIRVFGRKLKARPRGRDEAKRLAEQVAMKWLAEALVSLLEGGDERGDAAALVALRGLAQPQGVGQAGGPPAAAG